MEKKIRVGVFGVRRGRVFMQKELAQIGYELVAVCDKKEQELEKIKADFPTVEVFTDYDEFLKYDMDAVVLANFFHEHAPFAIKALEANKHVMSECVCNSTLAEGVALCRAVEKSGKIYMLAENYPYLRFNQEMTRIYKSGALGEVIYADGEYNHPMPAEQYNIISPGERHWRNLFPAPYYCTHALAPLMMATETLPVRVTGFVTKNEEPLINTARLADAGSVIICEMDNGAIFRIYTGSIPGQSVWYRYHCTKGGMENMRGGDGFWGSEEVRIWKESYELKEGEKENVIYRPGWGEYEALSGNMPHGGSDFFTCLEFAKAIRTGIQPYLNVYNGVAMSSVGIMAWRSALNGSIPVAMPDFRDENDRKKYENDHFSPFVEDDSPYKLPNSLHRKLPINKDWIENARNDWKKHGYNV